MKRLAILLILAAGPALAQEQPRDWQAIAAELQAQVSVMSTRAASCASDLGMAKRELESARKPAETKSDK